MFVCVLVLAFVCLLGGEEVVGVGDVVGHAGNDDRSPLHHY